MNIRHSVKAGVLALGGLLLTGHGGLAANYSVNELDIAEFGTLDQTQVGPNGPNGNCYCAPTATMNSFTFLSNAYPQVYGNSLMGGKNTWQEAAKLLADDFMHTTVAGGTTVDNWVDGKVSYIATYSQSPRTIYEGMVAPGLFAYTGTQQWVQNTAPTAAFFLDMLQQGEDVEIGLAPPPGSGLMGHVMTLSSLDWNDLNNNLVFDAGDTLTIDGWDPTGDGTTAGFFVDLLSPGAGGLMEFVGGRYSDYTIFGALAESVPEPSGVGLIAMAGALTILCRGRRK